MDKNINNPKITVLMPVYNGEKYLGEAIDSILSQTFTEFEFLIINDGSSDNTEKIIKSYKDRRIKLINNEKNLGLIQSLNKGFTLSKGDYIIRMDADDISMKERLEEQIKYMELNREIDICGSYMKNFGDSHGICKQPTNHDNIVARMLFKNPINHPSVIIKKERIMKLKTFYDNDFTHCEDYYFWTELSQQGIKFSNIKKSLCKRRVHKKNVSVLYNKVQNKNAIKVKENLLRKLKINPSSEDLVLHCSTIKKKGNLTNFLNKKRAWLEYLLERNNHEKIYKEPEFSREILIHWLSVCKTNAKKNFIAWKTFWKSPFKRNLRINNALDIFKFFIKSITK